MRDEYSLARTGWARFSDDGRMRYRLARSIRASPLLVHNDRVMWENEGDAGFGRRVVWVMLNPSTADAFKLDPTIMQCVRRSRAWDADLVEVVNLFAFRSPHPRDLFAAPRMENGDDPINDQAIRDACDGAALVIAAWGNGGTFDGRDVRARAMLAASGVQLHHLGLTEGGSPKHPLARGRHRIPDNRALLVLP